MCDPTVRQSPVAMSITRYMAAGRQVFPGTSRSGACEATCHVTRVGEAPLRSAAMSEWGPLTALIGEWEGTAGEDVAFSHSRGEVFTTPYLEKVTMKPFGPVDNGTQSLYGLDYRTAMWRDDEANPFHTEVGYWLWDAATGEVLRGFVVPRGITVLAGAIGVVADATSFTLSATLGDPRYGISENAYLGAKASSVGYSGTVTIIDGDTWAYDETTMLAMAELPELLAHTDHNTLVRTG